jgi:O-antigen ligase
LWLLISTISRIGQVAYLLSVGLSLILVKRVKAAIVILAISLVFIATSAGIIERFQRIFNVYAESPTPVSTPVVTSTPLPVVEDRSTSIRLNVEWPRAIRAFEKNPIIGTGYSSIGLATDNDYLRMLGETGILGIAAFGLVIFRIGKLLIKDVQDSYVASIVGALVGTLLIAVFIDIFEASKFAFVFWALIGCAACVAKNKLYAE